MPDADVRWAPPDRGFPLEWLCLNLARFLAKFLAKLNWRRASRKSPLEKCATPALAGLPRRPSLQPFEARSAQSDGQMRSGCPIWKRASHARRVAREAPMSDRTSIGTPEDRPAAWGIGRSQVPKHARRASTNCQYSSRMQFGLDYWSRRPLSWPRGLCHARAHCIDRFGRQVSTSSGIDFSEPRPQLHSVLISSSEDIPPPGLGNVGCCP